MDDLVARVADLLTAAGHAHHQAYIESDGADPEWPIWYAGYLQAPLNELLGARLTRSEIVHHMLAAEGAGGDAPWNRRYAERLVAAG